MRVLSLSLSAQPFCHYLPFLILTCLILHIYGSFCTLIECYQSNVFSCRFCPVGWLSLVRFLAMYEFNLMMMAPVALLLIRSPLLNVYWALRVVTLSISVSADESFPSPICVPILDAIGNNRFSHFTQRFAHTAMDPTWPRYISFNYPFEYMVPAKALEGNSPGKSAGDCRWINVVNIWQRYEHLIEHCLVWGDFQLP